MRLSATNYKNIPHLKPNVKGLKIIECLAENGIDSE